MPLHVPHKHHQMTRGVEAVMQASHQSAEPLMSTRSRPSPRLISVGVSLPLPARTSRHGSPLRSVESCGAAAARRCMS